MTQDTKIGGINFKKGDAFNIDFDAIHFDSRQWQKPYEFIPERFDHTNPISLKPNGEKRSPSAWAPFAGGKRMCFAPNFAQQEIMLITTYLTQFFDLKFVDPKFET